jgi:sigma-B regulation protein RsbU (phosphoserine phosphatase)
MTSKDIRDILVVDDSDTIRRYLKVTLERAGYHVRVAADAAEACREIEDMPPDYIISDWQMPNMNGADLCKWVREANLPSYVYFILVTAHERVFDVVDGLDAGADDYVQKPIKVNELLARLRCGERILRLERRLRALAAQEAAAFMQELH